MLELVPPGRVIFMRPLKTNNVRTGWDAVWVKAEEVIREVSVAACRSSWPPQPGSIPGAIILGIYHASLCSIPSLWSAWSISQDQ